MAQRRLKLEDLETGDDYIPIKYTRGDGEETVEMMATRRLAEGEVRSKSKRQQKRELKARKAARQQQFGQEKYGKRPVGVDGGGSVHNHPSMETFDTRLTSIRQSVTHGTRPLADWQMERLAKAGFFYCGAGSAACWSCGIVIPLEDNMLPLCSHLTINETCPHLKRQYGGDDDGRLQNDMVNEMVDYFLIDQSSQIHDTCKRLGVSVLANIKTKFVVLFDQLIRTFSHETALDAYHAIMRSLKVSGFTTPFVDRAQTPFVPRERRLVRPVERYDEYVCLRCRKKPVGRRRLFPCNHRVTCFHCWALTEQCPQCYTTCVRYTGDAFENHSMSLQQADEVVQRASDAFMAAEELLAAALAEKHGNEDTIAMLIADKAAKQEECMRAQAIHSRFERFPKKHKAPAAAAAATTATSPENDDEDGDDDDD